MQTYDRIKQVRKALLGEKNKWRLQLCFHKNKLFIRSFDLFLFSVMSGSLQVELHCLWSFQAELHECKKGFLFSVNSAFMQNLITQIQLIWCIELGGGIHRLTCIFRSAPFLIRSFIISCCLFSAAKWRQPRPEIAKVVWNLQRGAHF